MAFEHEFFLKRPSAITETEYQALTKTFLHEIINEEIYNETTKAKELIRVPRITKYLKFEPFAFKDQDLLAKNNLDILNDSERKIYFHTEVDIQLHFPSFLKEYITEGSNTIQEYDIDFLINTAGFSMSHYIPLESGKYTTLSEARAHLCKKVNDRFTSFIKKNKYTKFSTNVIFFMPSGELNYNLHTIKVVLEIIYK